jgi:hypothetical protein
MPWLLGYPDHALGVSAVCAALFTSSILTLPYASICFQVRLDDVMDWLLGQDGSFCLERVPRGRATV